jgi:phosphatidylglycerophosphate synthase
MFDSREHLTFSRLWQSRHDGVEAILDRLLPYNLSVVAVYFAARWGWTPNVVSMLSGAAGLVAFLLGLFLSASEPLSSVFLIYVAAQLSYIFDCADGQLARATGTASKFGDFFDKSVDMVAFTLVFGGFFGFLYRHKVAIDDTTGGEIWLVLGFLFLMTRTARFASWQRIQIEVGEDYPENTDGSGLVVTISKNLMDMQASLFGMLLFPFAPNLCFLIFASQAVIMGAAYVRYFLRAKQLYQD